MLVVPGFHVVEEGLGCLAGGDGAVEDDGGGDAAGADAAGGEQGEEAVGGGFAGCDFCFLLDGGEEAVGAFDVAGGAHADDAGVFALGFEGEEVIEGGDAVDAAGGEVEVVGDEAEDVVVEVAEKFLGFVEDFDERFVFEEVALHVDFEDFVAFVGGRGGFFWRGRKCCCGTHGKWERRFGGFSWFVGKLH